MVVTRKKNFSRPGRPRRPSNSNQGNPLELKSKFHFSEPNIMGTEGSNLRIADSRGLADPTIGSLGDMAVQNLQRIAIAADENEMEVCNYALSSEHAI